MQAPSHLYCFKRTDAMHAGNPEIRQSREAALLVSDRDRGFHKHGLRKDKCFGARSAFFPLSLSPFREKEKKVITATILFQLALRKSLEYWSPQCSGRMERAMTGGGGTSFCHPSKGADLCDHFRSLSGKADSGKSGKKAVL